MTNLRFRTSSTNSILKKHDLFGKASNKRRPSYKYQQKKKEKTKKPKKKKETSVRSFCLIRNGVQMTCFSY